MKKFILCLSIMVSLFSFAGCKHDGEEMGESYPQKTLSGYFAWSDYVMSFMYEKDDYYLKGSFVEEYSGYYKSQSSQEEDRVCIFEVILNDQFSFVENYSPLYESITTDHEYYSVNNGTDEQYYGFVSSSKECSAFMINNQVNGYIVKGVNNRLIFFPEQDFGMPCNCEKKDISYSDVSGVVYLYDSLTENFTEVPYWGFFTINNKKYYCINR